MPASGPRCLYCPVASCPCSDPARAAGWAGEATLRGHVDAHLAGRWQEMCRMLGSLLAVVSAVLFAASVWLPALACTLHAGRPPGCGASRRFPLQW